MNPSAKSAVKQIQATMAMPLEDGSGRVTAQHKVTQKFIGDDALFLDDPSTRGHGMESPSVAVTITFDAESHQDVHSINDVQLFFTPLGKERQPFQLAEGHPAPRLVPTTLPSIEKLEQLKMELDILAQLPPDLALTAPPEWVDAAFNVARASGPASTGLLTAIAARSKRPREEGAEPPPLAPKAKKSRICEGCRIDSPSQLEHSCLHEKHVAAGTMVRLLRYDIPTDDAVDMPVDKLMALYMDWTAKVNGAHSLSLSLSPPSLKPS
jgi:hypothetical protein